MEQQRLEYLTPYLPYELEIKVGTKRLLLCTNHTTSHIHIDMVIMRSDLYKPILRKVSSYEGKIIGDIKKELELSHNKIMEFLGFMDGEIKLENISLGLYEAMCKHHVDFNNLIEKGLALNINNPNN